MFEFTQLMSELCNHHFAFFLLATFTFFLFPSCSGLIFEELCFLFPFDPLLALLLFPEALPLFGVVDLPLECDFPLDVDLPLDLEPPFFGVLPRLLLDLPALLLF